MGRSTLEASRINAPSKEAGARALENMQLSVGLHGRYDRIMGGLSHCLSLNWVFTVMR